MTTTNPTTVDDTATDADKTSTKPTTVDESANQEDKTSTLPLTIVNPDDKAALNEGAKVIRAAINKAQSDPIDNLDDVQSIARIHRELANEFEATGKVSAPQLANYKAIITLLQRYIDGEFLSVRNQMVALEKQILRVESDSIARDEALDKRVTRLESTPKIVIPALFVGIVIALVWFLLGFHKSDIGYQTATTIIAGLLGFFGAVWLFSSIAARRQNDDDTEPQSAATANNHKAVGASTDSH